MSTQSQSSPSQPAPTPPPAPIDAMSTQVVNKPTDAPVASQEEPQTLESALEQIKQLTAKRDQLLKQQEAANKEIKKIEHRTRIESLKSIVPRELFSRSDHYLEE